MCNDNVELHPCILRKTFIKIKEEEEKIGLLITILYGQTTKLHLSITDGHQEGSLEWSNVLRSFLYPGGPGIFQEFCFMTFKGDDMFCLHLPHLCLL